MERSQSEVTTKIRSSIKKKLSEISDFVDDELPEYIMILVANQRSKSQITKDLSLFLRDDTEKFTDWLWDLLNNLKIGYKSGQSSNSSKTDLNRSKRKEFDGDDDAVVLDCDPDEDESDFLSHDDTNDSPASKSSILQINSKALEETGKQVSTLRSSSIKALEKNKNYSKLFETSNREPLSSAVVPVKKQLSINSDDEYDPAKPEYVSSSCNTLKRKYGGSSALQANKLLLKAVDDATKSILEGKSIEDFYKPTPIKVLTSKRYRNPVSRKRNESLENKKEINCNVLQPQTDQTPVSQFNEEQEFSADAFINDNFIDHSISPQRNRTICLRTIPLISNSPEKVDENNQNSLFYSFSSVEDVCPKSPHFIVTLEGVNLASFKRKREDTCNESMPEDEDLDVPLKTDMNIDETSPEKRLKLHEKCKYWPACKNSDHCSYHHPTVPCKCFPDCKFGDKCLYIHPNCKFDALCSRKDCPYTHASKRKLPLSTLPVKMVPVKSRKVKPVCKFYPKCISKNCPYIHPKLCRYGTDCRLPTCLFGHFSVPSRSQMKWQAAIL